MNKSISESDLQKQCIAHLLFLTNFTEERKYSTQNQNFASAHVIMDILFLYICFCHVGTLYDILYDFTI